MGKTEVQQVGLNLVDPNSKFGFLEVFEMLIAIWTFVTLSFGDMKMGPFCWGKHMTYDDATHISSCLARNIIQGKRQRAKARHCKRYMVLFSQWKSAVHPYPFICFKHLFQNYFYMLMFDVFVHVGFYMILRHDHRHSHRRRRPPPPPPHHHHHHNRYHNRHCRRHHHHHHRHHHHHHHHHHSSSRLYELTSHSLHLNIFNHFHFLSCLSGGLCSSGEANWSGTATVWGAMFACWIDPDTWLKLIEGQPPSYYRWSYVCSLLKCCENEYGPSINEIEVNLIWHKLWQIDGHFL